MHDYSERRAHTEPITAVIHHGPPARRNRWATAGPLLVGAVGVMMAAVTLAMFLIWKGSVTVQISQLRHELTAMHSQAASTSAGLSGLSRRIDGVSGDVNALGAMLGGYSAVCQQDLTGPNGPAAFDFPCSPHVR
jgi:hypothetical protein